MAQIDWMTVTSSLTNLNGYLSNYYLTSPSGSAVQHNTLTNAITSSGDWCRIFSTAASSTATYETSAIAGLIPINNSLLTSSVGYPYGYSYSLRAWARTSTGLFNQNNVSLVFKSDSDLSVPVYKNNLGGGVNDIGGAGKGYKLSLYNDGTNQKLNLWCSSNRNNRSFHEGSSDLSDVNKAYKYILTTTISPNSWVRMRMDVRPLIDGDMITIFTGSQTEGQWSQIYQVTIPRLKTLAYIPWYNNPVYPSDNTQAATSGYMGIMYFTYRQDRPVYIDQFEVYREAIVI